MVPMHCIMIYLPTKFFVDISGCVRIMYRARTCGLSDGQSGNGMFSLWGV